MFKFWANVFAMLGVALLATAFFRDDWIAGICAGSYFILLGAWLYGLSLDKEGKK